MENLGSEVMENTMEAVSTETCKLKRALPVLLPIVVVIGAGTLVLRVIRKRKANKAIEITETEEVNPES
ncbi:MAG: hypothetical protein ACNA7U_03620 [Candidatus Izemoplasmataceae bacterium]